MEYLVFLDAVIDRGLEAVRVDYVDKPNDLAGATAGFEACRGKTPEELKALFGTARRKTFKAYDKAGDGSAGGLEAYWWLVRYESEVEWVCNCVSAMLANSGLPTIITPTARGWMQAANIIGVAAPD
jgi:hypothetical protein